MGTAVGAGLPLWVRRGSGPGGPHSAVNGLNASTVLFRMVQMVSFMCVLSQFCKFYLEEGGGAGTISIMRLTRLQMGHSAATRRSCRGRGVGCLMGVTGGLCLPRVPVPRARLAACSGKWLCGDPGLQTDTEARPPRAPVPQPRHIMAGSALTQNSGNPGPPPRTARLPVHPSPAEQAQTGTWPLRLSRGSSRRHLHSARCHSRTRWS